MRSRWKWVTGFDDEYAADGYRKCDLGEDGRIHRAERRAEVVDGEDAEEVAVGFLGGRSIRRRTSVWRGEVAEGESCKRAVSLAAEPPESSFSGGLASKAPRSPCEPGRLHSLSACRPPASTHVDRRWPQRLVSGFID